MTGVAVVAPDNAAAITLPMRRIAELGHSSVALVTAPRSLMADSDRLSHFRRLARDLDLAARVVYSPLTIDSVTNATRSLLSAPGRPTSVITNSDYTAHAVYKAARELGLRVGPQVSVVGHDDLPTSELLDPPLATIRLDRREMGRQLMRRLLATGPPDDFIAPVELVHRSSLQEPETSCSRAVVQAAANSRARRATRR
jgi:LacI family transcriptional regulator